jgi:hypothetical protein
VSRPAPGSDDAVSEVLVRRYRALLVAYPPAYRARRGGELLATLLDGARPGQRWPRRREAASIAVQGMRARLDAATVRTPGAVWSEGLHRGALLVLGYAYSQFAVDLLSNRLSTLGGLAILVLALSATVAALRDHRIAALGLTVAWLVVSTPQRGWSWPVTVAVIVLAGSSVRWRSPRQPRSPGWVLAPALMLTAELAWHLVPTDVAHANLVRWLADGVVVAFIVFASVGLVLDPRIPIGVACLGVGIALENVVTIARFVDAGQPVFRPRPEAMVTLVLVTGLFLGSHLRSRQLARL